MCENRPESGTYFWPDFYYGEGWGYESVLYETPATWLFNLKHLYSSDPYKIRTSYTLIHFQLKSKIKFGSYHSKIVFDLGKRVLGDKSAREAFFEGLINNFLSDKTQFF